MNRTFLNTKENTGLTSSFILHSILLMGIIPSYPTVITLLISFCSCCLWSRYLKHHSLNKEGKKFKKVKSWRHSLKHVASLPLCVWNEKLIENLLWGLDPILIPLGYDRRFFFGCGYALFKSALTVVAPVYSPTRFYVADSTMWS